jgi:hypothetical protein
MSEANVGVCNHEVTSYPGTIVFLHSILRVSRSIRLTLLQYNGRWDLASHVTAPTSFFPPGPIESSSHNHPGQMMTA